MKPLISVYTSVYNAEPWLHQSIESVLNQTLTNFEYIILNNGSTDRSGEIINSFAAKDHRIRVITNLENVPGIRRDIFGPEAKGKYITQLDADDWWEPDYLERLVKLAEENDLDIVCTGNYVHEEATGTVSVHCLEQQLIMSPQTYADQMGQYIWFFQALWSKLIRADIARKTMLPPSIRCYADTMFCHELIRNSVRLGIDNSALHHYRVHNKSLLGKRNPTRFDATVLFYRYIMGFLSDYGADHADNVMYEQNCYDLNLGREIYFEVNAILPPEEKLYHYRYMITHPLTQELFHWNTPNQCAWMVLMLQDLIAAKTELNENNDDFSAVVESLSTHCGAFEEEPLVREHIHVCCLLKEDKNTEALDQMDRILRANENLNRLKLFLRGYIALAEQEGRPDLIRYGKFRLAKHYFKRKNIAKCRALVDELVQLGAGGQEEVLQLQKTLEQRTLTE